MRFCLSSYFVWGAFCLGSMARILTACMHVCMYELHHVSRILGSGLREGRPSASCCLPITTVYLST